MKRLNVKLVAWLSASSIILVAGVYLLHGAQIKETTRVLKEEAETAKQENDPELAVRKYRDYLQFNGGDAEAQVTFALLTAQIAEGPEATWRERRQALEALEVALRRDANNDEVRRKLLDYSLMFHLFGDAKEHAQKLLDSAPKDGDPANVAKLLTLLAVSQGRLDKERDAVESLKKAIETDPHAIEAYLYLAQLLREKLDNAEEADKVAESMVKENSEDAQAHLQHARYVQAKRTAASPDESARLALVRRNDVIKALELAPDNAEAILIRAQIYSEDKDPAAARDLLTKGIAKHPKDQRMSTMLASLEWGQGDRDKAKKVVDDASKNNPKDPNLRLYKIELDLEKGDLTTVRKQIDELELIEGVSREIVDYLRARTLFAEKKWAEARLKLDEIRPRMRDQQIGIDLYLGRCHEMLGEPEKQIEVYQRALSLNPDLIAAHVGLSTAMIATGKFDDARKRLEAVLAAIGVEKFVANPLLRNNLINLLLDYNGKRPEKDRDWSTVSQLVDAAVKAQPDALEIALLQSEVLARMGKLPETRKILEAARDKNPKSLETWLGLARLDEREGNPAAALAVLDRAEQSLGDSATVRTVRLGLSSLIDDETAKKALSAAAQGIEKFTPDDQERMWRALGIGYYRLKDTKQASQWWGKSVGRSPGDLRMRLALFEIASQAVDDAAMRAQIDDLKKFVRGGESPEVNYFEARRLVQLARTKDAKDRNKLLDQARGLLKRAAELRPRWAAVPRAEAEVDDMQGRLDEAIVHLERTVELGDTDTAVLQRVIELLQRRGRDQDADKYFALMSARNPGEEDLPLMSLAERERRKGNLPKAIELTEKAVKQDPENPRKLLYLGQLYSESGRIAEAEKTMSLAVEKGSDLPLTWLALMKLLVDSGKSKEARELMDKIGTKLPPQEGQLVQAQGFELLKDHVQAEALLRKARDAKPDDLGLSRVLAMFLFRTQQVEKAGSELERIVAAKAVSEGDTDHQAWANREMARVDVAKDRGHAAAQKALDRIRQIKDKTVEDKVTMAAILSGRTDAASRTEAIQILEELGNSLTGEGRYTLAVLYDRVGNWAKCREQMLTLLSDEKQKKEARHLAHFIQLLLKHREVDLAETWVVQLEALLPGEPLTIASRARWLVRKGRNDEGVAMLRTLVPQPLPPQNVDRLVQVAKVMEELELYEAAESMYGDYVALVPNNVLVLAEYFGRRGRLKEAMDVCEQALTKNASPEYVAQVSLTALRSQPKLLGADEWARIDGWFKAGLAKKPDSLLLRMQLAEFYDLQGKNGLVEETYRGLLEDPKLSRDQQALIMNNLAFLLAVQRKTGEASQFIAKAIEVMGPTSDLLDTWGMVLLSEDKVEQAIAKFNQALADKPTGTKYFHLAQAHLKANDTVRATDAMKTAMEDYNLKLTDLGELEQPIYKRLVQDLGL